MGGFENVYVVMSNKSKLSLYYNKACKTQYRKNRDNIFDSVAIRAFVV